ncbi:transcription initiation factor TFIID subunit 1-like [Microplitis mediator]|uniref:transcription initiation factor TFIID subunit 1-like n=1 Tax=Microplitis mediator TaxID=375433 RepID=UPI0025570076|nr:transcription initiation factor TFIID subunit 1-like [Microplitis mediator]
MALLDENSNKSFNLIGFMFGNIDNNGQLENHFFDDDAQRHLSSLDSLGFDSVIQDVVSHEEIVGESYSYSDDDVTLENQVVVNDRDNDIDHDKLPGNSFPDASEEIEDLELEIPEENVDIHADDDEAFDKCHDTKLSPVKTNEDKENHPYSYILPAKYANVDVTELFPNFRPNKVLRFHKLFGEGKFSSLPNIWRGAQKLKKNHKQHNEETKKCTDSDQEEKVIKSKGWVMNYGPDPDPDQCASDDELKLLAPVKNEQQAVTGNEDAKENVKTSPDFKDWRFGPAKYWFDMMGVPETGSNFDYGFKLAKANESNNNKLEKLNSDGFDDDAFLMVSQLEWENNVVWDSNDVAQEVARTLNNKNSSAGWIPSSSNRKAQSQDKFDMSFHSRLHAEKNEQQDETFSSLFPVENDDLVYGLWENEVIWDAENMKEIPKPKILTLDLNDDNIILEIPEDVNPIKKQTETQRKAKNPLPYSKKSKTLLNQIGILNIAEEIEEKTPPEPSNSTTHDPFNISNDVYYMPKEKEMTLRLKTGGKNLIQHSIPVMKLSAPFIRTFMGPMKLRNFHRPPLRRFSYGPLAHPGPHPVHPLLKYIEHQAEKRERERIASGGGDVFFMRSAKDLSGRDGQLILVEFSEEHPPLMNAVGMCSKIKNYYRRKVDKDQQVPNYKYGETVFTYTSPFLGSLAPGQSIQTLENNMYRAPIYEHKAPQTDFLVIRTRDKYFIREVDNIFIAGQQCPLYEVPGPNSKLAVKFTRDFLLVFIYRLFWKSTDTPKKVKMEDIKKAFPLYSESSIRKRLKLCANFKRTGMYSNWWVMRSDFRLPSEEEIQEMVSPEQCCAYFSMKAAEQRLKDAGYGEKFLFASQNDDDDDLQLKMDDEIKVAPWNTSRAYIHAMEGKCLLQLTGPADPTGCGEGFSYVRMSNKPIVNKNEQEVQPKKTLNGTDADLRRLSLPNAKQILKKFQIPDEKVNQLGRWEIIDLVRTLSTEKAKAGEQCESKFSRGNRFSVAEYQERYKEECQRIFNLQNSVLSSAEVLSSDENVSSDDEDDSDIEEMGKNIENILANKTTSEQLTLKQEEQERQELKKMFLGETSTAQNSKKSKTKKKGDTDSEPGERVLKINRTFRDADGKEFTRVEIIRNSAVIDLYLKIKNTNDKKLVNDFMSLTDEQKEERRKEKRRLQERLRRINKHEERKRKMMANNPVSADSNNSQDDPLSLQRPSKSCPVVQNIPAPNSVNVGVTRVQEKKVDKQFNSDLNYHKDLVKVDGTKVKFSTKLIKQIQEENNNHNRTTKSRDPDTKFSTKKRRRNTEDTIDYNQSVEYIKPAKRRQTDPVISMSVILEKIINEVKHLPNVGLFLFPVNRKLVPDYYKIIKQPIDLQTIRENIRQYKYETREKFLADINRLVKNSSIYNGPIHPLTKTAEQILEICAQRLKEKDESLMRLEKAINPFMGDNDQVKLAFLLDDIVNRKIKTMTESKLFLNFKKFTKNTSIVKTPMDLNTIIQKIASRDYHNRYGFLHDVKLILDNCIQQNSSFVREAEMIFKVCEQSLNEYDSYLTQIESNIVNKNSYWLEANKNKNSPAVKSSLKSLSLKSMSLSENASVKSKSDDSDFIDVVGDEESLGSATENKINTIQEHKFSSEEKYKLMESEDVSKSPDSIPEEKVDIYQDLECSDDENEFTIGGRKEENFETISENQIDNFQDFQFFSDGTFNLMELDVGGGNSDIMSGEEITLYQSDLQGSDDDECNFVQKKVFQCIPEKKVNLLEELEVSSEDDVRQENDHQQEQSYDIADGEIWF